MAKLTISIVNYNAGDYLLNCLRSITDVSDEVGLEVWVVDNASSDGSFDEARKKYPNFHYIKNKDNLGFSKAQNQVLGKLSTPYCLILNPDSELKKGTLKYMIEFMDNNPSVGASSCKVVKRDGSIDWASHRGFPTPWASFLYFFFGNDRLYHLTLCDLSSAHEVDAIVGAFFLTRKSVMDKVGLFDEAYFMYAEDLDLCYRIKKAGFKIMYVPEVEVLHLKGVSSGIKSHSQEISKATLAERTRSLDSFYSTMLTFYKKNLAKNYPFFLNWIVYLGVNLKWRSAKRKLVV